MLFYIVHNFIQAYKTTWSDSQRNCFTFAIGGTLHVLLYITLQYLARICTSPYLELLSRFYGFFVLVDAATMAILYKLYWGRSILNEMSEDSEKWVLDEKNHTYRINPNKNQDPKIHQEDQGAPKVQEIPEAVRGELDEHGELGEREQGDQEQGEQEQGEQEQGEQEQGEQEQGEQEQGEQGELEELGPEGSVAIVPLAPGVGEAKPVAQARKGQEQVQDVPDNVANVNNLGVAGGPKANL